MPGSRSESVNEENGVLRITVREAAERNMANNRVREIVAAHSGVPLSKVRMILGQRSFNKTFTIISSDDSVGASTKKRRG